ncbi:hypothetical protein QBC47DRAFT_325351 [Echria macrotheca]|uniref:Uncharacterized protein n=1 Tax=Echria macrotheca TaxID=438768 RepID=A0AAJ0B9K9_9PEZI|nr:hypothetical protein QBC47DRAFT_325351 [Echria macrotheca]
MKRIPSSSYIFLLLAYFTALITASAPTFCKCTCFTNSTIIPLGPQSSPPKSPPPREILLVEPRAASSDCSQCNRKFCLDYNLPICKDAEEKDVTTKCFQRDSRKDQVIVWGFVLGTAGLLGWAGVRRVLEMRNKTPGAGGRGGGGGGGLFGAAFGRAAGSGAGGASDRRNGLSTGYSPLQDSRGGGTRGGG